MKRLHHIGTCLSALLLLLTACQQDEWKGMDNGMLPGDGVLRFQGVNAQQVQVSTRAAKEKGFFKENSHYRIWAYGRGTGAEDKTGLRFNACGRDIVQNEEHYISFPEIGTEGSSARNKADLLFQSDTDVIDFYGLIDPAQTKEAAETEEYNNYVLGYLQADNATTPDAEPIYTVELQHDDATNKDTLPDLRHAVKTGCKRENTSYVIPLQFKHILSKVSFEIVQETAGEGSTEGKFGDLYLESIQVLNQSTKGTFNIKGGKFTELSDDNKKEYPVTLPEQTGDDLPAEPFDKAISIGVTPKKAGSVLLFPMIDKITEHNMLKVAVKLSTSAAGVLDKFTKSPSEVVHENGKYSLTITCPIYANPTAGNVSQQPLKLEPNYEYVLQFMIMSNDVRIITIVPRVYEWLDGETSSHDEDGHGYEEQDMGQPVTFNGVVWSDRNLGATSAHPLNSIEEWRKSVGYFYQYNRNIPYFPNTYDEITGIELHTDLEIALDEKALGDIKEGTTESIDFQGKKRKLYPVVDFEAWGIAKENYPSKDNLRPRASIEQDRHVAQLGIIPDVDTPFWGINLETNNIGRNGMWMGTTPFKVPEQPCPKGWRLPTQSDFLSILPGSAYAGNITFRYFNKPTQNGGWNYDKDTKSERDFADEFKPGGLAFSVAEELEGMINNDGESVAYFGNFPCVYREENNDPTTGEKSCYVLSMLDDDWNKVLDGSGKLRTEEDFVYNWGVIYGIKNVGKSSAYRIKWEFQIVGEYEIIDDITSAKKYCSNVNTRQYDGAKGKKYNGLFAVLVISRYSATASDKFEPDENGSYEWVVKKTGWWDNPIEVMYLPVCGVAGKWNAGHLYNVGAEAWYGSSFVRGAYKDIMWLKVFGSNNANQGVFFASANAAMKSGNGSPKIDLVNIRCIRDN